MRVDVVVDNFAWASLFGPCITWVGSHLHDGAAESAEGRQVEADSGHLVQAER
jgi:hypothetical protein